MKKSPRFVKAFERAYRHPKVVAVTFAPVFQGDDFAYELGLTPHLHHTPNYVTRTLTHAWAIVSINVGTEEKPTLKELYSVADCRNPDVPCDGDVATIVAIAIESAVESLPAGGSDE